MYTTRWNKEAGLEGNNELLYELVARTAAQKYQLGQSILALLSKLYRPRPARGKVANELHNLERALSEASKASKLG